MKLIDRVQARWLKRGLKRFNGNMTHTAKWLGISIRTLRNWQVALGQRDSKSYLSKKFKNKD